MDSSVPRVQLKRVNPIMGLMIDAQTWGDAHEYHRQVERAHALALHGWGIVSGFEVDASNPPSGKVWIRPGVALDPEGRLIIRYKPTQLTITIKDPGFIYLVLMYKEGASPEDESPKPEYNIISAEDGKSYPSRLFDISQIRERPSLPDEPYIELARIQWNPSKPVTYPEDPTAPKGNEIDSRYREQVAIRPGPRATIGVWKPDAAEDGLTPHLAGPTRLMSVLTSGLDWHLRRRDHMAGRDSPLDCDLLIMPVTPKTTINDGEKTQLSNYLNDGGVVLVEACASGGGGDAQKAMASIAQAVGHRPQPVSRDHPILTARHIFSAPPQGVVEGKLFEGDGLILSTSDYTCAWNGGTPEKLINRADIRAAVEFAENMLAYALIRRGNARRAGRTESSR